MALSALSLPIDIPWKLLATSTDMYAESISSPLPVKWQSSLAVFRYDVVEDAQDAEPPDELTSFLKIVATVTGYQPEGAELDQSLLDSGLESSLGTDLIKDFESLVGTYYPAYAAIVQVAVFPASGRWDLAEYPYLTDFQPRKREVVELASDTGEALTQSTSETNVRKGTTSTNSTEIDNIDKGFEFTKGVTIAGYGGTNQLGVQKQAGTVGHLGSGTESISVTDTSRQSRETLSHTTSLSQLYQVLDSYHAGTNRAVFFLNARPHLLDSPYTFVNGPRRLEGIQEFFLVVRRPKEMGDFCTKAVLETAHLHETDTTVQTGDRTFDTGVLTQTFSLTARGGSGFNAATQQAGAWTIPIPGGYKLDRTRGGTPYATNFTVHPPPDQMITPPAGVDIGPISFQSAASNLLQAIPVVTAYDDHVDLSALVAGWFDNGPGDHDGRLQFTANVYYISIEPTSTPKTSSEQTVDLFLTAREVRGCTDEQAVSDELVGAYVSYEKTLGEDAKRSLSASRVRGQDAAIAANAVNRAVREEVIQSFREERRYPPGAVPFLQSRFALRSLYGTARSRAVEAHLGKRIAEAPGLPESLRSKLADSRLTVGEILALPVAELAKRERLSIDEARDAIASAVGVRRSQPRTELPSASRTGSGNSTVPPAHSKVEERFGSER